MTIADRKSRREIFQWGTGVIVLAAAACVPAISAAETHIVEMRGLEFIPAQISVNVGDTITWVNADVMPHTATAADGSWDSGLMEQGDEWSLLVESDGDADYLCTFHPNMVGVVSAD